MDKCTNCGTPIQALDADEYEAKLSDVVEQTGHYPSSGLRIDVEREDGTVESAWLAPMEKGSTAFECPRCGKPNLVRES